MRTRSLPLLVLTLLALSGCQTSSLTESEQAPVQDSSVSFSGEPREIDVSQSVLSFVGKSDIVNHEGKFNDYSATVKLDSSEPANLEKASIQAEIRIASVEVDAAGLQKHLLKDDFFAAETYPTATFASTDIRSKGSNQYRVTGDLTIKGITKSITFDAEITDEYLTAHYDLSRQEFGIGNDSYGKKLLEEMVPVEIKLVFRR